jgi:tRNA modification GTPase
VRLSGPDSLPIGQALVRSKSRFDSHSLRYASLVHPASGETLDKILAVYMAAPQTYTGEDVFELHLHGSPMLCDLAVRLACERGARLATPGEFTQRAFLNGKLDLAQAEAVLDLIHSRHIEQARLAAQHLEGRFSQRVAEVRDGVLGWLALLEAEIDFGDEIDNLPPEQHRARLDDLLSRVQALLDDAQQGRVAVQGLQTVLVGAPNAGKSSLLNALLREDRALVTPVAGTTRDRIEVDCSIDGVLLSLTDTAGLRKDTDDPIEILGMAKTREALSRADLQVLLVDSFAPDLRGIEDEQIEPALILLNKSDLGSSVDSQALQTRFPLAQVRRCELLSQAGREAAVGHLLDAARQRLTERSGECFSLNQRHRQSLLQARAAFQAMEQTLGAGLGSEFLALDLRRAAVALGEILGLDITEEVLDRIFGQFCLGK